MAAALVALFLANASVPSAATGLEQVRAHLSTGETDLALAALRRIVSDDPQNATAHNMLGSLLNREGHYADALPHAERAVVLEPGNAKFRYNRGVVRAEHGRFAEAIDDFDAALAADPKQAYAWLERGAAKLSLGDPAGARADWQRAREVDPSLIWTQWYEATGHFAEGRFAEAAAGFDRVAASEPQFVPAMAWSVIAHGRAGQSKASPSPPNDAWPAPIVKYLRGQVSETELLAEAAKDTVSGDARRIAEARFFIAQHALITGRRAAAIEQLHSALAIPSPRHAWRVAAERDMKLLAAD